MQWYSFLALPPGTKAREDNIKYLKEVSAAARTSVFLMGEEVEFCICITWLPQVMDGCATYGVFLNK